MCKLGTGLESEGNAVTFINYRLEYVVENIKWNLFLLHW